MEEPTEIVSSFFSTQVSISTKFLEVMDQLNNSLEELQLPSSIKCIYNPTKYARRTFEMYVQKYCNTEKQIMYFGMNPGPWGMSQTGVPFGEINSVKDWLKINGVVEKPPTELPARPVKGFECTRSEVQKRSDIDWSVLEKSAVNIGVAHKSQSKVDRKTCDKISGRRFWGLFKELCVSPENFFRTSFVYNYLPQQWMKSNGCNLTPGDFGTLQMEPLYNICDPIFIEVLKLYEVQTIVAIGKFCETRALKALKKYLPDSSIQVFYLPHPSPRTVNNNNWDQKAIECLKKLDLLQYYTITD